MPQAIPAVVAAISYVGSAASAVVAGTATLAQIATVAAVGIGAGVGGIAASKALTPEIGSQGAAVRWEANPDAPLRFAFGRVGVKGSIIDAAIYGPDRMYVSFACTVSAAGPIKRFVSFRAGDYYMTFDGAGAAVNEPYRGEMWLATRLGAQPDTALSLPSGLKNGAAFPGWGTARKLSGSACYLVTLGENSKRSAYEGKVPGFVTVIEGLFCYDPRQDSTYPGGSGSCRLNNPATWVWTQNPILFALKWTLGLWEGPTGKGAPQVDYQVGGIGAKVESIRLATVVEAANVADANGWTSAAWPSTDDDKAQVLDGFLKAGGARYAEIAGQIAFIHRAAPRAPVFTIRARDTAGPVEIDTASSKLNRINTVRPRYWSEAHDWEMTALPEVTATEWQIEDGQGVAVKRTRGADFTFVDQPKQARELASLEISNSREGIKGRVPLRPYMDPEPGNTFIFDEPDFALSNLKCIVLDVEDNTENDTVVVTFETETDGKYPYAYGQMPSPPPAQELDPYDPTYVTPPLPGDWTITPRPPAPGGGGLPSFDLTGVVSNDTATAIIVEYGPTATGPWKQAYQGPPTVTNIPIEGLQPGATYYVAVQYQRNQNYSDRYVYGPYTAPLLDPSPNAPTIQAINADITAAFGDIFDVSALVSQARTDIDAQGAEIAAARGGQGDLSARLSQLNQFRIDGDTALGTSIENLASRTAATEADIIDIENTAANDRTATAQAIQQVSASINAAGANILTNSTFANGLANWTTSSWIAAGPPAVFGYHASTSQTGTGQLLQSDAFGINPSLQYTLSCDARALQSAGTLNIDFCWFDASGGLIGYSNRIVYAANSGQFGGVRRAVTVTPPSNATSAAVRVFGENVSGLPANGMGVRQLKVEVGSSATVWRDDKTIGALSSSITQHSLAITDLENQQALASWSVIANASGGKPARIGLTSSSLGSFVALDAPFIFWGDNTVFDDATDTLQTTVGPNIRVLAFGAPFGASENLLEWWGPSSIAIGSMTTANGLNGRMTTTPYVFDTVTANQAPRVASVPIDGRIGYNQALNTAALTAALAVPAFGKFVLSVQLFSTSDNDGSVISATGTASLKRLNGASETTLVSGVNVSGQTVDPAAKNTSALNVTVANSFAGNVTFRLDVQGGGGPSTSHGTVQGTLTVTWYPI